MSDRIVIIGAGATAVHFAATALLLGRKVLMLDVGRPAPAPALPGASLNGLKTDLDDPVRYFLGEDYGSLILPTDTSEYYGFPPSKNYVFKPLDDYAVKAKGFEPLMSFAAGGLAQAWTAGAYPFNEGELEAFPFGWAEMAPAYGEVARRIGVSGVTDDDLSQFYPAHDGLLPPIQLDAHSQFLLDDYASRREKISGKHGLYLGRSRSASLSRDHAGRKACSLSGRCLWGCPSQSIYTPSVTLQECLSHENFEYRPGVRIAHFTSDASGRVTHVAGSLIESGEEISVAVGELVLAAGALSSTRIFLESLLRAGVRHEAGGLMDNRQVLMPFVNFKRLGAAFDDRSYQYHQIAIGAPGAHPFDYVHGLVTTLTTAMAHPVAQSLPVGMRAAMGLFRNIHGALGLANINFADTRREENRIALEIGADGRSKAMLINYTPDTNEPARVKPMIKRFRGFLAALGCVAPPNMTRMRPMGASVHYAGTVPMQTEGGDFTTSSDGRCRPFKNLIFADGSTFSSLPAKNLTFTLMANSTRIARAALG
ncbi:MAG: NAD(P)/FAD-dependent oxidoreductase [Terricaulis sp.]|nr:NAD(P)/FAD-dependent oxidoreductase [Terricaulis sp.]